MSKTHVYSYTVKYAYKHFTTQLEHKNNELNPKPVKFLGNATYA